MLTYTLIWLSLGLIGSIWLFHTDIRRDKAITVKIMCKILANSGFGLLIFAVMIQQWSEEYLPKIWNFEVIKWK